MNLPKSKKKTSSAQPANSGLLGLAVAMAILFSVLPSWGQDPEPSADSLSVIDGDTLEVAGEIIQLDGIDAPELGQTCLLKSKRWRCGLEAAYTLKRLIAVEPVTCTPIDGNEFRARAVCVAGLVDLAEQMLRRGYAVTLESVSPSYKSAEMSAKSAGLGLWRSNFVQPWEWREGVRLPGGPADEVSICEVKGTIDSQSRHVFYLPSDKGYEKIEIDPSKGERMFCSDDEALLAGWKRFPRQ
jgi:endonuclease YncB( thermonuclease family)